MKEEPLMEQRPRKLPLMTLLVILTIGIGYVQQMAPSPILMVLSDHFGLAGQDALLNLSLSIIFPASIVASLAGGTLEAKLGIRRLFILAQVFLTAGVLVNFVPVNYFVFLAGRVIFSLGFGLAIPFIGSAIMNWYTGKARDTMNTLNGMFPFIGTVISFALLLPLSNLMGSWQVALGVWGVALAVLTVLWLFCIKPGDVPKGAGPDIPEKGIYWNLLKRKNIKLLCIVFMLDFFCYSYIAAVLPTFMSEGGGMEPELANLCAALAFPAIGIVGGILGGGLMSRTGKRKSILTVGQIVKLAGMLMLTLGMEHSVVIGIAGAAVYGLGNGMWMPVMYTMPMEMEGMTPSRTGAAFAFISSAGFLMGFLSPIIGGALTSGMAAVSTAATAAAQHAFGLKWSLCIFGFTNLIAFIVAFFLDETHPGGAEGA